MTTLRILSLFPRHLDLNGCYGNVLCLAGRAEWRGIETEIIEWIPGEPVPSDVDLVVCAGFAPLSTVVALAPVFAAAGEGLRALRDAGVPIFANAAGWSLLGERLVVAPDGDRVDTARVFATTEGIGAERKVGEYHVAGVAGFVNRGTVRIDAGELLRSGASLATDIMGPFLPMNPSFADEFLTSALGRKGEMLPAPISPDLARADEAAARARTAIAVRLNRR
ncbi:cobyric acid synthase [Gryllotalpicola sp.]|uniref:cobyric acid synthase n=1 Tax=Gryllotalpicola sp. TaxID=1932787 RepID=UPI0026080724|nr:cobyric acid synthase [Gryllotalpicola sp.]